MKILIIGSGGREHAIAWKLSQNPKVEKIYAASGNAGINLLEKGECVNLKTVDEILEFAEEKKEKEIEAEKEEEEKKADAEEEPGSWKAHIKGQMEEAEEKARKEAEEKEKEMETPAVETEEESLTEEDCRELWRIIQGLEREYKEMNSIADDWFSVHGKKTGCMAALAAMTLLPLGAVYGLYHLL